MGFAEWRMIVLSLEAESYVADVIFDWEKGANGSVDTWIPSGPDVIVRDSK